jgi:RNA polymerase sigma factor for flagellar operon FliA
MHAIVEGTGACAPAPDVDVRVAAWWREYLRTRGGPERDRLAVHYMETLVRRLAERLHSAIPGHIDLEDLMQQGYLGLIDAIGRFDPDRSIRFETFASQRIFGAMRDYLRQIDPLPRLVRARTRRLEAISEDHFKRHGRPPSDETLRDRLQVPARKLRQLLVAKGGNPRSAAQPRSGGAAPAGEAIEALPDRSQPSPLTDAEKRDLKRWVTRGFTRRDHLIIVLYYFEQMTMREVGDALGISESRVSQRLDTIVKCLRARLAFRGAALEFT